MTIPQCHDARPKRWPVFPLLMLLGLGLGFGQSHSATGQGVNADETGVRHAIVASIEPDENAAAEKRNAQPRNAAIDIEMRVLDYASDYRFYGVVKGKLLDFDPASGAPAREIWADSRCHQSRGLPKIWVLAINGKITRGEKVLDVAARPRQIGVSVPKDEVVTQRDRNVELNDPNRDLVTVARTTDSGITLKLNLTSTKCRLGG